MRCFASITRSTSQAVMPSLIFSSEIVLASSVSCSFVTQREPGGGVDTRRAYAER